MKTSMRCLIFAALAWILWIDQTVYDISRQGPTTTGPEGANARWQQLAVLPSKEACEAIRSGRVLEAAQRDGADRTVRYPERFRFFCSPAVDSLGK
jgi:hypothetical protein